MRRTLALAVAALATVSTAQADPTLRYSWDQCDPVVRNKDFSGPGVYRQTLTATDLPAGFSGFSIGIALTGPFPAWQFFDFGCQGADRFTAYPTVEGCGGIPGLVLTYWALQPPVTHGNHFIVVQGYVDPPLPADMPGRTGLVTLEFDHARSGTTCGGEGQPVCFVALHASYELPGYLIVPFPIVDDYVSWQDAGNSLGCPGATPASTRTWGHIKALYR